MVEGIDEDGKKSIILQTFTVFPNAQYYSKSRSKYSTRT